MSSNDQFLAVADLDWLDAFVDKSRKTWHYNVGATLRSISSIYALPMTTLKSKGRNRNTNFTIGYSLEAVAILKEKMEKHPHNFDNGRMLKWE